MRKPSNKTTSGWRRWWVEILTGVLILMGLFLLFEDLSIREILSQNLREWTQQIVKNLTGNKGLFRPSNIVGFLLLLVALGVGLWRVKYQLALVKSLRGFSCPRCQGTLERSHRRFWEKPLSFLFGIRPYRCTKKGCGWRGWRYRA